MTPSSRPPTALACAWVAAAGLVTMGCARPPQAKVAVRPASHDDSQDEVAPRAPSRIPFALATREDAIVRVVVAGRSSCSGTLVDEDLVLTAHHCVVKKSDVGELTPTKHRAEEITVELGGDDIAWGQVSVKHVVTPPCGHGGGRGDVAVLVLERKLVGVATMPTRLDAPPHVVVAPQSQAPASLHAAMEAAVPNKAKHIAQADPIGFGRCASSAGGVHRRARTGGDIETVSSGTFRLKASVCPGDSGGPVLLRGTQEIVGVMSMSAMDGDERTAGMSIVARIDAVRPVFAQARAIADGASPAELPPISCP